jgi:hypothetical protein
MMKQIVGILLVFYFVAIILGSVSPWVDTGALDLDYFQFRTDYFLHALAFLVIPVLSFIASGMKCVSHQWKVLLLFGVILAFGAEFLQLLTPSRTFNPLEFSPTCLVYQ